MGKKPMMRKRLRSLKLTIGAMEQLILGYDPFFEDPLSEDELKTEYLRNKRFILSTVGQNLRETIPGWFVRGIVVPWGHRPAGWWSFDAPEGRRLISGDPAEIWPCSPLWFGKPRQYTHCDHSCVFESQPAYLKRLGLLMPGEAEKITRIDIYR